MPFPFLRRFPALGRTAARLSGAVALLLLGACGGASRVEPFVPSQGVVFGDESSLVQSDGTKYSVNYLDGTGARLCQNYPVWSQQVLSAFGLVLAECNPNGLPVTARMRAAAGARAATVAAQISAYQSATGFSAKTLVTVMGGMWDVRDHHDAVIAGTETVEQATAAVQSAAATLGNAINQMMGSGSGARVLYATLPLYNLVPSTGRAPAGNTQSLCRGSDVGSLLQQLTCDFNVTMRLTVNDNGYYAGLVKADVQVARMTDLTTTAFGISNITAAACTTAPPACTTSTLQSGALSSSFIFTYLWADTMYLGPSAQGQIGVLAETVARTNPF